MIEDEEPLKKCSKCGEWKPFSEFHKDKCSKDGVHSKCKKCRKEYYENNKDQILEYNKKYYENNKDQILEYNKKYYENNKDQILEQKKDYYENNKEKIKEYRENNKEKIKEYYENNKEKIKEYYENNYVRRWCSNTIYRHKTRGYIVNITIDELYNIVKDKPICEICGKELEWYSTGTGKVTDLSPTLDRTYNRNEINKDNISILCHKCNMKKNSESIEENLVWCKQFIEYANNKFSGSD